MKKCLIICCAMLMVFAVRAADMAELLTDVNPDPVQEFARWQQLARKYNNPLLNIASLATIDKNQYPQQRYMCIKEVNDQGFVFTTHEHTSKVKQLMQNNKASLIFLWPQKRMYFQIKVTGEVEKLALAKTRSTEDNVHKGFYEYVLKPNFIQFSVTDKSSNIVTTEYVNYIRDAKGAWEIKRAHYKYSKIKSAA